MTSTTFAANFSAMCAASSFDVTPKKDAGKGRFLGRIWVEDQDYNIVRLNGTYARVRGTLTSSTWIAGA